MTKKDYQLILKSLIDREIIKKETAEKLVKEIFDSKENPISVLIKKNVASEEKILKVAADKLGLLYIDLKNTPIKKEAVAAVPLKSAAYYKIMPIDIKGDFLTVATGCPLDIKTQDHLRIYLGYKVKSVLSRQKDILDMLKKHYGLGAGTVEGILAQKDRQKDTEEEELPELENAEEKADDASVVRLVHQIILDACQKRATDIHIEPYRNRIRLRYRIDGVLYKTPVPPEMKDLFSAILSRIKIMSNLNTVERRLPQDGQTIVKIQGEPLDLRISFMPTSYGESVVVRILPKTMLLDLKSLGLTPGNLKVFENIIKKPHGIIFVTGPTGSGKTTTLYTCLSKINTDEVKIVTIEDPVEYKIDDVTQVQVKPQIGLDFVRCLRSMLRHDPDVMMVGEVRDLETAQIAIRVALTGHLVFSTLHTNDAASGITRLINIGIEPYLVASSVEAFIAQRLIRTICPKCKVEDKNVLPETKREIFRALNIDSIDKIKFYRGKGCEHCNHTGFLGRTAIYEILLLNDPEIKELILSKTSTNQIKKAAIAKGMRTLRQDGWNKVIEGITTVEEVMRVTPAVDKDRATFSSKNNISLKTEKVDNEKRLFPRRKDKIKIEYKVIKSGSQELKPKDKIYASTTTNIGTGGLAFESNQNISMGSILEINIKASQKNKSLKCLSKVARAEWVVLDKIYKIGVYFLDLSGSDRNFIKKEILEK